MKTLHTLALFRADLGEAFKNDPFSHVTVSKFPIFATGVLFHEDLIVFVDDDGCTKILKNRYGKTENTEKE